MHIHFVYFFYFKYALYKSETRLFQRMKEGEEAKKKMNSEYEDDV